MSYIISRPWGGHCGIGHQFFNWLTGRLLANRYGLTHVHAPFCGEVLEPQIDMEVKYWEQFLRFGDTMLEESKLSSNIKKIQIPKVKWDEASYYTVMCDHPVFKETIEAHKDKDVLFECAKDQFVGLGWEWLDRKELREKYEKSGCVTITPLSYEFGTTNVAIHIRRGDVTKDGRYKVRWVDDEVYLNVIRQIRDQYCDPIFHIFSDGTTEQLSSFEADDTFIRCKENVVLAFHHMVCADILMPGQSMFSVLAGYLCDGIKIAKPWSPHWHDFPKNDKFIEVNNQGDFLSELIKEGVRQ